MSSSSSFESLTKYFQKLPYPTPYEFDIDTELLPEPNKKKFSSNKIRTTHYTLLSFFPKSLFLQFTRLANCYFLIIAILLSINIISPLNPFTAWAPLLIVIGISMVREGYEDYQRYKSDKIVNEKSFTIIIRNGEVKENIKWSEVIVGDICIVREDETFPADMILLKSSGENGMTFIETASLDGEKNLKPRNCYKQTQELNVEQLKHIHGHCVCPIPTASLHSFTSTLTFSINNNNNRNNNNNINNNHITTINISSDKQLLYRGTKLRNTEQIYGLVIYTGENTKIIKNAETKTRNKMSQVETKVNYVLGIILLIQLTFCIIVAIFYGVFRNQVYDQYYYIDWLPYSTPADSIIMFFTYMVLLNTMIPISLIVSIEIVKLFQKYFIDHDKFMFSEWRRLGVKVKSASLNEELGQVEYVFSDKTGTLTKNVMTFSKAIVGNHIFDLKLHKEENQEHEQENLYQERQQQQSDSNKLSKLLLDERLDFDLKQKITIKSSNKNTNLELKTFRQLANEYFLCLGLAHEVVTSQDPAHHYHGPSPDEICLVETARSMGYEFINSSQSTTTIKIHNKQITYELLQLISFSSERKRMSIIVRDREKKTIRLYIKGADNVIKSRLSKDSVINVEEELDRFSTQGLRTLLIAMKIIDNNEWEAYEKQSKRYLEENNTKELEKLQEQLESNLFLLGATAVQDDLQDDVPETIRDLLRANIKVWMLTGDKMETAESVGRACGLIRKEFDIMRFVVDVNDINVNNVNVNVNDVNNNNVNNNNNTNTLNNNNISIDITLEEHLIKLIKRSEELKESFTPKCLIIEGTTIHYLTHTSNKQIKRSFTHLTTLCESVICCRLLPIQKQSIVHLVRTHLNKITLAIGDGANDITMIKEAHIGIGLYGEEGMGAVQASDYALPEFRMLWRLLLVHGRWNYIRISEMILYFFYKNMLFTIPQFITAYYCAYSGQTVFDDVYVTLYNLIFTALPLIVRAVMEQDVNYMFSKSKQETAMYSEEENIVANYRHSGHNYQEHPQPQQAPILNELNMQQQQTHLPQTHFINKYFYRLFPKLYFIGQESCVFNYTNYFAWIIEGMIEATILTVFAFEILGDMAVNESGWDSSFWLVGVMIYTAVMFVVTFKLATHTKFWSSILIWTIILTSLGLYLAYMWISNYALSRYVEGVAYIAWTSGECYFYVLFSVCMILFVDGVVVWADFRRGSLASRMREIVYREKVNDRRVFDEMNVTITSGLTVRGIGDNISLSLSEGEERKEKQKQKQDNNDKESNIEQENKGRNAANYTIVLRENKNINNMNGIRKFNDDEKERELTKRRKI